LKRSIIGRAPPGCGPVRACSKSGDAVVVTRHPVSQARTQTLQPVNVITAEDVARSGQQTLVESCIRGRGRDREQRRIRAAKQRVHARGEQRSYAGPGGRHEDRLRHARTTAFENIPLSQIERIEVVPVN